MTTPARAKLTVYTALVGPKERLNNPLADLPPDAHTDLDLDFVCVTDNRVLKSDVWRFVYLPNDHLPPEKLSRRAKALPHEYFPEAEYSLYIDNTVRLRRLPRASDLLTDRPYLFRAFRHATRNRLQEEADAVAVLGYDDIATICGQLEFYASRTPLDSITPLTTGTVLLRSHHSEAVRRFGVLWWESLLAFSKRDQLSIDFALQQSGASIEYLPGGTHDSELIQWNGSLGPNRIRASFDSKRYAWSHRSDPDAMRDPKAHFLAHNPGQSELYQRRLPLLEYICFQQKCSLGSQVSPRRGAAEALESLLAPHRREGCRYLLVQVEDPSVARSFQVDELASASRALSVFMGRLAVGTLLNMPAEVFRENDKVYTAQQVPFDLLIVLGLDGAHFAAAVQKFMRLLAPGRGAIVAVLTAPVALAEAMRAEQLIVECFHASVHTALQGSWHDDEAAALNNTVIGLSWSCVPALAQSEPAA